MFGMMAIGKWQTDWCRGQKRNFLHNFFLIDERGAKDSKVTFMLISIKWTENAMIKLKYKIQTTIQKTPHIKTKDWATGTPLNQVLISGAL